MEEESDLVRLAFGGLAAPFPSSELEDGTDENEDRADLLRVNATSEFPVLLEDPKDWSDLLRLALWPIEETVSVEALPADSAAITEPEGDMETSALLLSVRLLLLRALFTEVAVSDRLETLLSRRFGEAASSCDVEFLAPTVS
jgi:hypothetical protein